MRHEDWMLLPEGAPREKMEQEGRAAGMAAGWELTPNIGVGPSVRPQGTEWHCWGESRDGTVHCGVGTCGRVRGMRPAYMLQSCPQKGGCQDLSQPVLPESSLQASVMTDREAEGLG